MKVQGKALEGAAVEYKEKEFLKIDGVNILELGKKAMRAYKEKNFEKFGKLLGRIVKLARRE